MKRTLYVVGNWKMHKTTREATDYIEMFAPQIEGCDARVFLAVPFTSIAEAAHFSRDTKIVIGAQNMSDVREGALTGEVSGVMLKAAGARFVLLGHSERRHLFGETNQTVRKKVLRALQDDLQPILCIGETLEEHTSQRKEKVLREQLTVGLEGIAQEAMARMILAYEPVWAIGTGKAATPELAQGAHQFCREVVAELFGKKIAETISILYGGSVKPEHVAQLTGERDIDGVLVGGASLDPSTFAAIARHCTKKGKKE